MRAVAALQKSIAATIAVATPSPFRIRQHAIAKASSAAPATRAITYPAAEFNSTPSNRGIVTEGATSNANPVTPSATAVTVSSSLNRLPASYLVLDLCHEKSG